MKMKKDFVKQSNVIRYAINNVTFAYLVPNIHIYIPIEK